MNSFGVVDAFEAKVAAFAGAPYAVATMTGTAAIFLSIMYAKTYINCDAVILPARTFVSVPMAVMHAGLKPVFDDYPWEGVYQLSPLPVFDGALRFRKGMYRGGLHCLSFHARKILNIGEGGMVLCDTEDAYRWLRKARYSGRDEENGYRIEDIETVGWQAYMTPEKAARGLHLMEYVEDEHDQFVKYADLRKVKAFQ